MHRLLPCCFWSRFRAGATPRISGELIFPLEKWHNHSSSVVETAERRSARLLVPWSGERTADDVLIRGARWNHTTRKWSAPFTMADTPGFPETNPVLFLDRQAAAVLLLAPDRRPHWETALMKYRISTDYQQADGPPRVGVSGQHRPHPKEHCCAKRRIGRQGGGRGGPAAGEPAKRG